MINAVVSFDLIDFVGSQIYLIYTFVGLMLIGLIIYQTRRLIKEQIEMMEYWLSICILTVIALALSLGIFGTYFYLESLP